MKHLARFPIYLLVSLSAAAYLTAANLRGWSLLQPLTPKPAITRGAPVRHK